MKFSKALNKLLSERNISQAKLSGLTGISRSSISEYLSSDHEPSKERKRNIAAALGLHEDYFEIIASDEEPDISELVNLPVRVAAKLMGKSVEWVCKGLQDGVFPWGYGVKLGKWSYFISPKKFTEYTGIEVYKKKADTVDFPEDELPY